MAELVVKRYATALFDTAKEMNALDQYESQVNVILEALKETPDFMAVLENHKITLDEKIALVEKIFSDKVENPILGLIVLMVKKGRGASLVEVLEAFVEMVKTETGLVKASVTSVKPLSYAQLEQIKSNLERSINGQVELESIIDTSIIAGLIIRVGDKVIDASVKGEMQTLKKQLSELRLA